jgi:hypothetical protein
VDKKIISKSPEEFSKMFNHFQQLAEGLFGFTIQEYYTGLMIEMVNIGMKANVNKNVALMAIKELWDQWEKKAKF